MLRFVFAVKTLVVYSQTCCAVSVENPVAVAQVESPCDSKDVRPEDVANPETSAIKLDALSVFANVPVTLSLSRYPARAEDHRESNVVVPEVSLPS